MPYSPRARSARALANDEVIREAAILEVLRVGVDRVSLRDVGQRAGFTHGATYARYEDVDELLVDLWISSLCERMTDLYERCLIAAREPGEAATAALVDFVRQASSSDVAALQLLLTARRIPALFEEVEPFISTYLARGGDGDGDDPLYTRATAVFAMLITMIGNIHFFEATSADLSVLEVVLLDLFTSPPTSDDAIDLHEPDVAGTPAPTNDLRSQLGYATFLVVGKSGYTHATISRIARRAKCSPGVIYRIFASKEDLVISSFRASLNARWMRIDNFSRLLDRGGMAQSLFDTTASINAVRRDFVLEFTLGATNVPKLRETLIAQTQELVSPIPLLDGVDTEHASTLAAVIRFIAYVTTGITLVSGACGVLHSANLSQFTEPFRRAVLNQSGPQWLQFCEFIGQFRDL